MEESKFWMVWASNGRTPTVRHQSEQEAIAEASRLCDLNPHDTFYVLSLAYKVKASLNVIKIAY